MSFWHDFCEHEKDHPSSYQGSFKFDGSKYDVYFYPGTEALSEEDICIRYGDEPHEYISAGDIKRVRQVIRDHPTYTVYVVAMKLVEGDWGEHEHFCEGCGRELTCTATEWQVDREEADHYTTCESCLEGDRIL